MIGKSVSHYQIVEKLGEGGMGVVWKARDSRLNRTVALKVMPAAFHDRADLRQRFLQEAQAASALSHPHIVTIYDVVEQDGVEFIVMEFVAGKTLDALIPRKGMRIGEALRIGVQVADALSAAHAAGIIHRDLKPGNVMVAESGAVKVLDFGLAKMEERRSGGEDEATQTTAPKSIEGLVVGTVGYMSPEQAEAKAVDPRSDVFSLGAMLYEMVTGERAFRGESNLATMAAILHKEPAPMGADIPAELQRVIGRCLRKDRRRRFQHMDDLMVALEELREESESGTLPAVGASVNPPASRPRAWTAAAAVVLATAAGGAWWFIRGTESKPKAAAAATELPLTSDPGTAMNPSFSPDGNQVAYAWNGVNKDNFDIYVKLIGAPTPLRLTSDPAPDVAPAFAPDGRTVGFIRTGKKNNRLMTISPIGGTERVMAELPASVTRFSWFPDGKSVVIDGLEVLSMETGERRPLTRGNSPAVAPDGHAIAFIIGAITGADLYLLRLDGQGRMAGEARRLTTTNRSIRSIAWTTDGQALLLAMGSLTNPTDLWRFVVATDGPPQLLPFGRAGATSVAIAHVGNRLAYSRQVLQENIWRLPLSGPGIAGGAPVGFLISTRVDLHPEYSPDGKSVAFHSNRSGKPGLWVADAEGQKADELYLPEQAHAGSPIWSPDAQTVAFDCNQTGKFQVYTIRAAGGKPTQLTEGASSTVPSWSHDGKWIYFSANRTGKPEIWKMPSSGGTAQRVTQAGGFVSRESDDGRFLYFTKAYERSALWRIPVEGGAESQVLPVVDHRLFTVGTEGIYYVISEDGKAAIWFLPKAGGAPKMVTALPKAPDFGISVSPDGRSLLYTQVEQSRQELMLVEGFR